ncbi:helix-turn-helix domain-containing protein [Streptomyces sp. NPDC059637]|uniref:helix-turn-helix domain-containing protein n=1 Tax=Streptomyces sp. NPDC059637 TaxID=3347752 RepID=UPI0036AE044D
MPSSDTPPGRQSPSGPSAHPLPGPAARGLGYAPAGAPGLPADCGLSEEAAAVYAALVSVPSAAAHELAAHPGVPGPGRTDRALEELTALGMAVRTGDAPCRYHAVAPDVAFAPLLRRRQERLLDDRAAVARLAEAYRAASALRGSGDLLEILRGADAVAQRVDWLQRGARQEVAGFVKQPTVAVPAEENAAEFASLKAGVRFRVLYDRDVVEADGPGLMLREFLAAGEEARVSPTPLPLKMIVADREHALLPLLGEDGRATGEPVAVVVRAGALLDALLALFERIWATAVPLSLDGPDPAADGGRPSAEDRFLLSLVVSGLTDQAVATQLGSSVRTVQRRLRDLIALAGVETRLQLVWQAAKRGWV